MGEIKGDSFPKIINDIVKHYKPITIAQLAENFEISEKQLYEYKRLDINPIRPHPYTIDIICEWLENNNGHKFVLRLKRLPMDYISCDDEIVESTFPPQLKDEYITDIKQSFPTQDLLEFTCAMIIYENKALALDTIIPSDASLQTKAKFISRWSEAMNIAEQKFGLHDINDWQSLIIKNLPQWSLSAENYKIENLGQKILINIVSLYIGEARHMEEQIHPSYVLLDDIQKILQEIIDSPNQKITISDYEYDAMKCNGFFTENTPLADLFAQYITYNPINKELCITNAGKEFVQWMQEN